MGAILKAAGLLLVAAIWTLQLATAWADPWQDLRRPLHLPDVAPGEPCPVSPVDEGVDWETAGIFGGSGTGPGPIYPGLGGGDPPGHIVATKEHANDRWFATKVFWYATPGYRRPALLRGARLDGPGPLRFTQPLQRGGPVPGLRLRGFDKREDAQWRPPGARGRPSGVYIKRPGCYGVQIDGTRFSRVVIFSASTQEE